MTNPVDQSTFAMPLQTDPQLTSMLQTIGLHTQSTPLPNGNPARQLSVDALRRLGYEWPSVLDEDYPVRTAGGLDFKKATAHGRPYIQPVDPTVTPTPYQIHALKVLTHTFAILSLTPPPDLSIPTISSARVISPSEIVIAPHVNQVLQQLGLPPVPAHAQGQIGNAQIPIVVGNGGRGVPRQFPVRQLMAPLLLLLFRTAVLLYFFAPMRKPLVGVMLLGYMVYEIYSAVMRALPQPPRDMPGLQRGAGNHQLAPAGQAAQPGQAAPNAPAAGGNAAAAPAANNRGAQPFGGPGVVARRRNAEDDILGTTLDWIAHYHLDSEDQALHHPSPAQPPSPPPNFFQRAFAFVFLFLVTFYPAVWDKRRALLKTREGVVRTETRMRRQPDEEEEPQAQPQDGADGEAAAPSPEAAQQAEQQAAAAAEAKTARAAAKAELLAKHNRRANWVKEYIERVMEDEWVDDAD